MKPYINEKHRISGTRISVYDVYHYLDRNASNEQIMEDYSITADELQSALDFIAASRDAVHQRHLEIEERNARGNPPEVLALLEEGRVRFEAWVKSVRERKAQQEIIANAAGNPGRQQSGAPPQIDPSEYLAPSGLG